MRIAIFGILFLVTITLNQVSGQSDDFFWYKYNFTSEMLGEKIQDVSEDHLGYIWIMTASNLYFLDEFGFKKASQYYNSDSSYLNFISEGEKFIAQSKKAKKSIYSSVDKWSSQEQNNPIEKGIIEWELSPTNKLIRTQNSKKIKIDIAPEFLNLENHITFNNKAKVIPTNSSDLWLLGDNGLLLYKSEKRIFRATKVRNIIKQITAFHKDQNRNRTVYLTSFAIKVINDVTGEIIKDIPIPEKYRILPTYDWFIKGQKAFVWAGFGVFEFDLVTYKLELMFDPKLIDGQKINQTFCNFVTLSPDSSYLLLGAKGNLFYTFDLASKKLSTFELEAGVKDNSNIIFELDYLTNAKAIITSQKGIFIFDKLEETVVKMPNITEKLSRAGVERIQDLDVFQNNTVYFTTLEKGFYIYDILKDSVYQPINNIKDYLRLTNFVVDSEGDAWCGSSKGILHYQSSLNRLNLYNTKNGLFTDDFYTNICRYTEGKVFFGHGLKYVLFDPDELRKNFSARLNIQSIKVNNSLFASSNPIIENGSISLEYNQNNLTFEIGGSNYGSTQQFQVEYRLLGYDDKWSLAKVPEKIQFQSLLPSNYKFQYKSLGEPDIKAKELSINILQPFWTRKWVRYTAYFLGLLLLIGLYLYNIMMIKKRAFLQAEYERKIAKIQMDALRARMNPHFIFNSLNSIKSYIIENDSRNATRYLTKFAHLIRQILNNSKESNISLHDELHSLELYIEIEKLRFNNSFTYEIQTDTNYNLKELAIPSMILQPIVENAIWHGLLHKNGEKHLKILVEESGNHILATIEDNGVGRQKASEMKSKTVIKEKSLGTDITSERLNLADKNGQKGSIEIIDLFDDMNNPIGTKVILMIPISLLNQNNGEN